MKFPESVSTCFDQRGTEYDYDKSSSLGIAVKLSGYYTLEELESKIELIRDAHYSLTRDNAILEL